MRAEAVLRYGTRSLPAGVDFNAPEFSYRAERRRFIAAAQRF